MVGKQSFVGVRELPFSQVQVRYTLQSIILNKH